MPEIDAEVSRTPGGAAARGAPAATPEGNSVLSVLRGYGFALFVTALALGVTMTLPPLRENSSFFVMFAAVAMSALVGGLGPGLLAIGLTAILFGLLLFPSPGGVFDLRTDDYVRTLVFCLVAGLIALFTSRLRAARIVSRRMAQEAAALLEREREARAALESALSARDDFVATVGHELRNPLNVVSLVSQRLTRKAKTSEVSRDVAEAIEELGSAVDQLLRMTSNILDASQIAEGRVSLHPEELDLSEVVLEAASRFEEPAARAGCPLELRLESVRGLWDRARIDQVVTNLVGNAVKYGAGKPLQISMSGGEGWARLTFRDGGVGIAPEDQERIFERFERGRNAGAARGIGLGLWITRRTVEQMGGRVEVESRPGSGATFTVLLPLRPS